MAEISGSITLAEPEDNSNSPVPTTIKFGSTVVTPAAVNGKQDEYRVTLRLLVFDYKDCTTASSATAIIYKEIFVEKTWVGPTTTRDVAAAAQVRATAILVSEKKDDDGTYEPEVVLDRRVISIMMGNPTGCAPYAYPCVGVNDPVTGCATPTPAPGSTTTAAMVQIVHSVGIAVVGNGPCQRTYHFVAKWKLSGPPGAPVNPGFEARKISKESAKQVSRQHSLQASLC